MPTEPDNTEWIAEEQLADALGVPREKIRAERPHLGAGEVTKKGNVILWLRSAGERIAEKFGIPVTKKDATAATPEPKHFGEELTVVSQPMRSNGPHFGNVFLIKARRADGEVVVVRVLNSSKFLPRLQNGKPMTFRAQKAAAGNWWLLIGREPRFPGHW